jgi:hypothetical protein
MGITKAAKQRVPRGQWPPAEKRRIVELTLRAGALKAVLPANGRLYEGAG